VWRKLTPAWIQILSDDVTPELARVVNRINQQPMSERVKRSKDLGETMVIAHAVVAAERGADVTVLIDDGLGARITTGEIRRLDRLRATGVSVGSIRLAGTLTVLEKAAGTQHVPGRAEMREIYRRLRVLDDGLPPIEKTSLLTTTLWTDGC
jgi:hypothetical protein